MSILVKSNSENLIKFPIYYLVKKNKYNAIKVIIYTEADAKKKLEDENTKKEVLILNTVWKQLSWEKILQLRDQVNIFDATTNQYKFNYDKYEDMIVKMCLVDWDYSEKGQKIVPTPDVINEMHREIVDELFRKYDEIINLGEDDVGK